MNENEKESRKTVADIVAEKRELAKKMRLGNPSLEEIEMAVNLEYDANRIEALWKREKAEIEALALSAGGMVEASRYKQVYNAAAMREALDEIRVAAMSDYEPDADYLIEKCNAALSAPPRQCDVGTAEERYRRWIHFCERHLHRCDNCPCNRPEGCTFTFENMPYEAEEGVAK